MSMSCILALLITELASLATLKGTFDPQKHPNLLNLLDGGYTKRLARQTHAEDLLAEYIASCPGQFAFPRGFKPTEEQLREALHVLFLDPEERTVISRHEHIIINIFEMEGQLGWSQETFKRKHLRLLLKHLARHLAEQPEPLLSASKIAEVLAQLEVGFDDDFELDADDAE